MEEEINNLDIINKEETEKMVESEILKTINLIKNNEKERKKIKKILNGKNYIFNLVDDRIILSLSDFYLERNGKKDLETAKKYLNKIFDKKNPEYLLREAKILKLEGKNKEAIKKYQNCIISFYPLKKSSKISECFAEIVKLTNNYDILEKVESFFRIIDSRISNNNITINDMKSAFKTYFKLAGDVIDNVLEENNKNKERELNNILEKNSKNKEQELNNIFENIKNTINIMKEISSENIKSDIENYFQISEIVVNTILEKNSFNNEQELNSIFINIEQGIRDIKKTTPENIELFVKIYFKFIEIKIDNILEKYSLNSRQRLNEIKEQELDNIFMNVRNTINAINGDFSEINGKDRNGLFEKDEFFIFYQNVEKILSSKFDTYLQNCKNNPIVIDMLKTFSEKGSYIGFYKIDAWYLFGDEEYKNSRKNDMKKITESEYKMNSKDQTILQRVGQFIFEEENIDIDKVKKFFTDYKDCLELLKNNKENFKAGSGELARYFENILISNKNISIENIKSFEEEIKNLCDIYPYNFYYGSLDITDYYNIILDKKNFFSIFESFKKENFSESENNINSKSFNDFYEDLILGDKIATKLENFFAKIIDNEDKFEYYIFYLYETQFEKLEDLCPKFKGKTKELLKEKLLKKFEQNIWHIGELLNKNEIDEDAKKEISYTFNSLIKVIDKISEKKLKISQENDGKLEVLFDTLKNNNLIPEEVLENSKTIIFKYNLYFINDLLVQDISENEKQSLDEKNKKKINDLMEFVKNAKDEKIEILKNYKEGLKTLLKNLENNKNKLLVDEIKKHEEELKKLKDLNEDISVPSQSSAVQKS